MTIVLRHNADLELNVVKYSGSVTLGELLTLARFATTNPSALKHDSLAVVMPGADFDTVPLDSLDGLWEKYRALYAPLEFQIFRRSAWICRSLAADAHVRHWLSNRDMRAAMSSDVRQFPDLAGAADWLVLSPTALSTVERCDGFTEIARFDDPPETPRAAAS